jgi:hypothetical protein
VVPRWSKIVFVRHRGLLFEVRASGGEAREIKVAGNPSVYYPRYSSDSRWIFFEGQGSGIQAVRATGGQPQQIASGDTQCGMTDVLQIAWAKQADPCLFLSKPAVHAGTSDVTHFEGVRKLGFATDPSNVQKAMKIAGGEEQWNELEMIWRGPEVRMTIAGQSVNRLTSYECSQGSSALNYRRRRLRDLRFDFAMSVSPLALNEVIRVVKYYFPTQPAEWTSLK